MSIGVRHSGHPFGIAATASAHWAQKRECPQGTSTTRSRGARRHTSHLVDVASAAAVFDVAGTLCCCCCCSSTLTQSFSSLSLISSVRNPQCLECYNRRYSVEAWPLITDDGGHVTLGWSEIMGSYNTPDTVVNLNPKYSDINYMSRFFLLMCNPQSCPAFSKTP